MDYTHTHGTPIYVLEVYKNKDDTTDPTDIVAIAGEHSVQILHVTSSSCSTIATFHVGCRVTALAWSPKSTSPWSTDDWSIELAGATADYGLLLLTKTRQSMENIFAFGGGLSGHHGKITGMTFCGGTTDDCARYVATVSDDKMLMVWDLFPPQSSCSNSSSSMSPSPEEDERPQPTAYVIAFASPLTSVISHPSTSKELLVADCRGSIFLTDWRSDPEVLKDSEHGWRHPSIVELIEPKALSDAATGGLPPWSGNCSVAWRRDEVGTIGATHSTRFSIWDISKIHGGKPIMTGVNSGRFRWCDTYPGLFAIASNSPTVGATIYIYNTAYIHAEPSTFAIAPRPRFVRDFDFLTSTGIPRIAAAVGRDVLFFSIGESEKS